jgi:hypothetical protein
MGTQSDKKEHACYKWNGCDFFHKNSSTGRTSYHFLGGTTHFVRQGSRRGITLSKLSNQQEELRRLGNHWRKAFDLVVFPA